jgi:hypothetical protein
LIAHGVVLKSLPRYSPDLNPIEHIWSIIKHYLQKFYPDLVDRGTKNPRAIRQEMVDAVIHCWELLDPNLFDVLAETMVHRVQAVLEAEGWYTKY